jgi:flagellar hook-length control protein FliK
MSASLFQTNEKPVTAGIADATAPLLSSPHGTAPLEAGTSAGAHDFEHPPEGETPRDGAGQPVSTPSIAEVVRGFQPAKAGVESTTSSAAPEAARMIEQIEKDIERMRSQGGQRLEVRLPMRDGGEVVVKLHVEAGEVKAVFHTESSSLRDALESGWNQLASTNSDRAVKIGTVAFEGSSLQNGTGGFSQTPDQRRRALDTYQPDNVPFLNGPLSDLEKDQPNTPRRSVSTVSMAGLQIYA